MVAGRDEEAAGGESSGLQTGGTTRWLLQTPDGNSDSVGIALVNHSVEMT